MFRVTTTTVALCAIAVGIVLADSTGMVGLSSSTTMMPSTTSSYLSLSEHHAATLWIIVVGFILAFILAFGVGANDVANVFGTSVGAKVLTLRQACCIATVAEILGAVLLGYKVSDTVRKGILDVSLYDNDPKELMLGSLSALGGSALWNLVATFFKLPISGTHTIVGATIGFTLCAKGFAGVKWLTVGKIVGSWFISPVLSGLISGILYLGVRNFILKKDKPLEPGLMALPVFYGLTLFINVFSIVHNGPALLHFDVIPWWGALVTALGVGVLTALFIQVITVPRIRKSVTTAVGGSHMDNDVKFTFGSTENLEMEDLLYNQDNSGSNTPPDTELSVIEKGVAPKTYTFNGTNESNGYIAAEGKNAELDLCPSTNTLVNNYSQLPLVKSAANVKVCNMDEGLEIEKEEEKDKPEVAKLFSFLQVLTATFGSFAHGGNDVSNAIGPLIALWSIYADGNVQQKSETPIYILLFGGLGISMGLWIWGRRVIETIGEDLTTVTPSSGFTIEIGAAFTVLFASKIGLPISTTHCKVGSVVFVGWAKSTRDGVDWKLFRNIVIAWVVTVPLTAGVSALLMLILKVAFL
ncbi:unnamed protein product, partial [Meganyctiphanes norvegica]